MRRHYEHADPFAPTARERSAMRLSWVALVWLVAVLLMVQAGRGEPLELCDDGHPRPIGTCHE